MTVLQFTLVMWEALHVIFVCACNKYTPKIVRFAKPQKLKVCLLQSWTNSNIRASLWRCVEKGYIVTHDFSCCFADCARISHRLRGRTWTPVWISTFSQRANKFHLSRSVGLTLKLTTQSSSLHVYLSHGYELFKHHFTSIKRATGAVTSQY